LDARPLAPRPPHADPSVTTEFDPPAVVAEQVVFAAKALAEQLHEALAAEGLTCMRLGIEVTGADERTLTRLWRHDGVLSALAIAERSAGSCRPGRPHPTTRASEASPSCGLYPTSS
jgi:protein ImuB